MLILLSPPVAKAEIEPLNKNTKVVVQTREPLKPLPQIERQELKVIQEPKIVSVSPISNTSAKMFIYEHESGNDPTRWNGSGCLGLGQACPASKLLVVCPTMDYACEDAFFTRYMLNKYHTWENAKAFWLRTDPRPYPGHWW